jgi:hypothetical protein
VPAYALNVRAGPQPAVAPVLMVLDLPWPLLFVVMVGLVRADPVHAARLHLDADGTGGQLTTERLHRGGELTVPPGTSGV